MNIWKKGFTPQLAAETARFEIQTIVERYERNAKRDADKEEREAKLKLSEQETARQHKRKTLKNMTRKNGNMRKMLKSLKNI